MLPIIIGSAGKVLFDCKIFLTQMKPSQTGEVFCIYTKMNMNQNFNNNNNRPPPFGIGL